jgi:hypothetical protein
MTSIAPISMIKVLDVYRRQVWTGGRGGGSDLSWKSGLYMDAFFSDLTRPDPLNPNDIKSNVKIALSASLRGNELRLLTK